MANRAFYYCEFTIDELASGKDALGTARDLALEHAEKTGSKGTKVALEMVKADTLKLQDGNKACLVYEFMNSRQMNTYKTAMQDFVKWAEGSGMNYTHIEHRDYPIDMTHDGKKDVDREIEWYSSNKEHFFTDLPTERGFTLPEAE